MTKLADHVQWVKPPRQPRSQETLERLLDAAEAVLSEKGFEQATVAEIAARAKSSVGAFYARFQDKDALLRCLHDRFCEEALATADEALDPQRWHGASIPEIFAEVIPFLVRIYADRRWLLRAFIVRASLDESFLEAGARMHRHISAQLRKLLLARREEIDHVQPEVAVDLGLRMVMNLLDMNTLFGHVRPSDFSLSTHALAGELKRAYLGYLGIPSPAIADPESNGEC
jgi:AcrR family transcriptional regulator